jgi:hypothetical protein
MIKAEFIFKVVCPYCEATLQENLLDFKIKDLIKYKCKYCDHIIDVKMTKLISWLTKFDL